LTDRDIPLARLSDIPLALGLLTRLPVSNDPETAQQRGSNAAWAWPLAGLATGLIAGLAGWVATGLGASAGVSGGLVLVVLVMLSGAMHEDGLADTADGLWGGHDKMRRLEIMKDSRIGAYGVIALALSLILRWSALSSLIAAGWLFAPLIAAGMLSRAPMAVLMAGLPNARGHGLSQSVGAPGRRTAALGVGVAFIAGFLLTGLSVVLAAFWITLAVIGVAAVAKAKIGGQTGDILGAAQQVGDIAALATFAALIS